MASVIVLMAVAKKLEKTHNNGRGENTKQRAVVVSIMRLVNNAIAVK